MNELSVLCLIEMEGEWARLVLKAGRCKGEQVPAEPASLVILQHVHLQAWMQFIKEVNIQI